MRYNRLITIVFSVAVILPMAYSSCAIAQTQGWEWAKISTGPCNLEGCGIAVGMDPESGGPAVYGLMMNEDKCTSFSFGSVSVANPMAYSNAVLVKYNTYGVPQWAYAVPGNSSPIGITTDSHGNIYILGSFYDSMTIAATTLNTTGTPSYFIAKVSPAGSPIWAKQGGHGCMGAFQPIEYYANSGGIKADGQDNVYIASYFTGVSTIIGSYTLTNTNPVGNSFDMFLAKYDQNGNVIWAKNAGGSKSEFLRALAVTPDGNAYLAGTFYSSTISFGSNTITNPDTTREYIFIAEYDSSGNPLWEMSTGNHKAAGYNYVSMLDVDKQGSLFITGTFADTLTFGTTMLLNPRAGDGSMYLAKLDAVHHLAWYKIMSSPSTATPGYGWVHGLGVAVDQCGNAWIEGSMGYGTNSPYLYPYVDVSGHHIDSAIKVGHHLIASDPGFVAGFNPAGGFIGGKALQSGFDDNNGFACGRGGELYVASDYTGGYLGAGTDTYFDTTGKEKFLLAKYKYDTVGCTTGRSSAVPAVAQTGSEIIIYPNPAVGEFTVATNAAFANGSKAELYDITGRFIDSWPLSGSSVRISVAGYPRGLYLCRILDGNSITVRKIALGK